LGGFGVFVDMVASSLHGRSKVRDLFLEVIKLSGKLYVMDDVIVRVEHIFLLKNVDINQV
jgi:hypothetical protein